MAAEPTGGLRADSDCAATAIVLHASGDSDSRILGPGYVRFCPGGSALRFRVMTRQCSYIISPQMLSREGGDLPQIVRRGKLSLSVRCHEIGMSAGDKQPGPTVLHLLFATREDADVAVSLFEATFAVAYDLSQLLRVGGLKTLDIAPPLVAQIMQDQAFPELLRLVKQSIDSDATLTAIMMQTVEAAMTNLDV